MQLVLRDGLILTHVILVYRGQELGVPDVLVDTGSATTILAADAVTRIGITPEPKDILFSVRGVGGTETVFSRDIDRLEVGTAFRTDFQIEIGSMDYGLSINGILGMDFLLSVGTTIDLRRLTLEFNL